MSQAVFDTEYLARALMALPEVPGWVVAFSGGADSTALLHGLAGLRDEGRLTGQLAAIHVHHGLSPCADQWAAHSRAFCDAHGVSLTILPVAVDRADGTSLEAAAREARYAALAGAIGPDRMVLTAHHADDQAETVLLQLLRGAGPAGLAGMAAWRPLGSGHLGRPLLGIPNAALTQYCRAQGLTWIEDESNRDPRLARAYLRQRIMPRLTEQWPGLHRTIGRSATICSESAGLIEELAELDLDRLAEGQGALAVTGLRKLSPARQRNVLRHWIGQQGLPPPDADQLENARHQALNARRDAQLRSAWPGGEIRRYRDRLYAMVPLSARPNGAWAWAPPASLDLPNGRLSVRGADGAGVAVGRADVPWRVSYRRGGERLARGRDGAWHQTLKHLFQAHGVPPWRRERLPLIFRGEHLLAVPGVGIAEDAKAEPGEPGWVIVWESPEGSAEAH